MGPWIFFMLTFTNSVVLGVAINNYVLTYVGTCIN